MRIPLALYRNDSGATVEVSIGELPGEPPNVYSAPAGGTVEGPANYEEQFKAAGLRLEKHLDHSLPAPVGESALRRENGRLLAENAALRKKLGLSASGPLDKAPAAPAQASGEPEDKGGGKKPRGG